MADQTMEHAQPLTLLAEDERLFRDSVREFADRHVRPLVRDMDEQAKIPRSLVDRLFDLGVMAIEIPEAYGGGRARFFYALLAVGGLLRGDPSGRRPRGGPKTPVAQPLLRLWHADIQRRYLTQLASPPVVAHTP